MRKQILIIISLMLYCLQSYSQITSMGFPKEIKVIGDDGKPSMKLEGDSLFVCCTDGIYSKNIIADSEWEPYAFQGYPWESPQTIVGYSYTTLLKLQFYDVDEVRFFDGATYIIDKTNKNDGITIGSFININTNRSTPVDTNGQFAPFNDSLFAHEYGHYIQSQRSGLGYLFSHGLPSLLSAFRNKNKKACHNGGSYKAHNVFWTEIDANEKAADYFIRKGYLQKWTYSSTHPTY